MELLYLKNGEEIFTEESNEDVDISSTINDNRTIVTITAKCDIRLVTSKIRYNKSFLEDDEIKKYKLFGEYSMYSKLDENYAFRFM